MAVTTKKTFPATSNATTTVFTPVGIQLNNQDDLDVYVTLSGGTRVLQLRQSTGSTATSSHKQVNDTTGLYFPAVTAGTTLYNYTLSTDNNTITFNSALPSGAVVSCERRTRDADSSYTTFASGSTIRATDLNNSSTESNFTAQDGRNKAFDLEGKLFDGPADSSIKTKLDGIEANATQDQTASEIRALVESASDSNVFTDADHSKLNAIEAGATADQTDAEIRTAVENATDSNVFTDADHTKLNGISAGADVTSTNSINALTDVDTSGVADGKILKYSSSSSKFIIADDGGGGGGGSGVTNGDKGDITVADAGTVNESFSINNEAVTLAKLPHGTSSTDGKFLRSNNGADPTFETVNTDLVSDTSPQLGGNLDVQTNEINTSTTNGNVKLTPNGTGKVEIKGNGSNDAQVVLNCGNNSHGQTIKAPPHSAGVSNTFTLPTTATSSLGGTGALLRINPSGQLSFDSTGYLQTNQQIIGSSLLFTTTNQNIMFDVDPNNTHNISFKSPSTYTKTSAFTLPEDGTNGQFLKTNGSGVLSFADVTSTYNIQINTLSSSSGTGGGSATFNGSATRFTLSNAGTNAQAHIVSVNGVIQKPNSGTSPSEGFAIDGNDIIFASAPATGSDFFILTLGNAINLSVPADDSVTSAKIVSGAVSGDKIAQGGVTNSQILDDTISESKLDIHAAPSGTDKVLGYTSNGMEWVESAAGATGGGTDKIFWENGQTVTTNYTITNGYNAMSAGPVTINNGVAVTIGTGENWTIV